MTRTIYDLSHVPPETTQTYTDDAANDGDIILGLSDGTFNCIIDLSYQSDTGAATKAYAAGFDGNHRTMFINGAIENAVGSGYTDIINGNNLNNMLFGDNDVADHGASGGGGSDTVTGLGGNDYIYGGGAADTIDGGNGNDTVEGGLGADELTGGKGKDIFLFANALKGSADHIVDFNVRDDTFELDNEIFLGLKTGDLANNAFVANTSGKAEDAKDHIIYDTDSGALYFDHDGKGGDKAVKFATIDAHLKLTADDFTVIHHFEIGFG
jgi:Ca2+-binding RTX toxin-like protein